MKNLLVIDSSGRVTRSITRALTARFAAGWKSRHPEGTVIARDVGRDVPPVVDEGWIAAAFAPEPDEANGRALAWSDAAVAELSRADAVVIGVPMYNFGMPAPLKAYVDQVVRVGLTVEIDLAAAEPYRGLLAPKPVVVIVSAGDGAVHPGGALAHMNFLEPHLATVLGFIGLPDVTFLRVGYDEYQDDRWKRSLAAAERAVDEAVARLG